MKPTPITMPSQSRATALWWARRWYKNASPDERAAMQQVLAECGIGGVQVGLPFD